MTKQEKIKGLSKIFDSVNSEIEFQLLIPEIMTESEIERIHERFRIIDALNEGRSQRDVKKITGSATATITRGSAQLQKGADAMIQLIEQARQHAWWRKLFWGS